MMHGLVTDALKDKNNSRRTHAKPTTPCIVYSEIINAQGKRIDPYKYIPFLAFIQYYFILQFSLL